MVAYFSDEVSRWTLLMYALAVTGLFVYSIISLLAPLTAPPCTEALTHHSYRARSGIEYKNIDYLKDACKFHRYVVLGGLNKWECEMCVRVIASIVLGSFIGWERRRADRAAGIRTMAMVCMGSCVFTIDSVYAFWDGPMNWDASRVSAAIPSGVGFLGAASIWKGTTKLKDGTETPEVHGLTTATSVWLSAAVGILAGGGLYVPAFFSSFACIVYLRFAPRSPTEKMRAEASDEPLSSVQVVTASRSEATLPPPGKASAYSKPNQWPPARAVIASDIKEKGGGKPRASIHI